MTVNYSVEKQFSTYTDEELMLEIIRNNSSSALTVLHNRYSKRLLGFFIRMLNNDKDRAQDFLQDLFLKIIEKKQLFDPEKRFYTWVFTIAGNMCKTAYRKPIYHTLSTDERELFLKGTLDEDRIEKERFHDQLRNSLLLLEEHHKTTFVLRYMEKFSLNEISEIMEVSIGTVKSRLFYATKKMASYLKEYDPRYESELFKMN